MKIHANQLSRQLKGPVLPLYWVSGDETLLVQEATDHIRQHLRQQDFHEREVWHVDATLDWQALLLSANSLSLFTSRKRLELRFSSGKPGEKALKLLAAYAASPNADCALLISGPKVDPAAARSKAFKLIEDAGLLVQVWPIDAHKLPEWINTQLQQAGYQATREAVLLLSERVEGNLLAARQEIDKLVLSAEPGERLDASTVASAVADSSRHTVFDLNDPMLRGNGRSALRIINGLREEGSDATALLWTITRDLRKLVQLRRAIDHGQRIEHAMDKQGIWKKQQGAFRSAAVRLSQADMARALEIARRTDLAIKGLTPVDPWNELRTLVSLICGHTLPSLAVGINSSSR